LDRCREIGHANINVSLRGRVLLIHELLWPMDRVEHIARHGITPDEVEEVCLGRPLILRAKSQGESPAYYVLGQSKQGRYLFAVILRFADGKGFPVTARPMTPKERRRYQDWKNR